MTPEEKIVLEQDRIITYLIHTTDGNKFPQSGVSAYFQVKYYTTEMQNSWNVTEDRLLGKSQHEAK